MSENQEYYACMNPDGNFVICQKNKNSDSNVIISNFMKRLFGKLTPKNSFQMDLFI